MIPKKHVRYSTLPQRSTNFQFTYMDLNGFTITWNYGKITHIHVLKKANYRYKEIPKNSYLQAEYNCFMYNLNL